MIAYPKTRHIGPTERVAMHVYIWLSIGIAFCGVVATLFTLGILLIWTVEWLAQLFT